MTGFVFWMLVASALGFFKSIGLAAAMTKPDFGNYGARFGLATLAAAVVSFGIVERTIKAYPRRWEEGNVQWIREDARAVVRTLSMRFAVVLVCGVAGSLWLSRLKTFQLSIAEIVVTTGLAMGSAWLNLLASVYRAVGSHYELQRFQLQRTAAALTLAMIGGWRFGWIGALAGDVSASAISIVWSNRRLARVYAAKFAEAAHLPLTAAPTGERGHHELYFANLLSSSTQQADKSVVLMTVGASLAGTYSVVMLIPAIAQMLVNVIVQYIGPLIIKFAHVKHRDRTRISAVGLQAGLLAGFSLLLAMGVFVGRYLPVMSTFIAKYSISNNALLLAATLAAAQIFSVIEFHLIAHDRERVILIASLTSTALFFALYGIAAVTATRIEYFLGAGMIARVAQLVILQQGYRRTRTATVESTG